MMILMKILSHDVENWDDKEITKKEKNFTKDFDKIFKSDQKET